MITKRSKFAFLFYTSLLLILCFEKTVGYKSTGSHGHTHTTHVTNNSHSRPSHPSHGGHGSGGWGSSNSHPSHPISDHQPNPSHGGEHSRRWGSSNPLTPRPSVNYPIHNGPFINQPYRGNLHTPPPPVYYPINSGYPPYPGSFHTPPPSVNYPRVHPDYPGKEPPSEFGWKGDVYPHPLNGGHGSGVPNHPSYNRNNSSYYPRPSGTYPVLNPGVRYPSPIIIYPVHTDDSKIKTTRNYYPHLSSTTPRPIHYQPVFVTREEKDRPVGKPLVSGKSIPSPRSSCGMTLCPNVVNYPLTDISNVVNQANRMFDFSALKIKGISKQNFISKLKIFSYGRQDLSSSCKAQTNTIYPQEGYSGDDDKAYYVVNVPSLRQGLVNIYCESSNQMCRKHTDASASLSKVCRQMYREEQLLVLPANKRIFTVDDFQVKKFHVPTGCNCIAY